MKNVKRNVNGSLKETKNMEIISLRHLQDVVKDIKELEDVLSCYKYFQASYEASQMPDAYQQIEINKSRVRRELSKLYAEHSQVIAATREPMLTEPKQTEWINYIASPIEENAIMLFNSDKRFKITE